MEFLKPIQPFVSIHAQWIDPGPPGRASTTPPSRSVMTSPDEAERMMKVEPGQGTDEVLDLKVPRGSWSERKLRSLATVSGGVVAR